VAASGPVKQWRGRLQMIHPVARPLERGERPGSEGIVPRYPVVEGVGPAVLRKLCGQVASRVAELAPEPLPEPLRRELGLPLRPEALRALHAPDEALPEAQVADLQRRRSPAHRRLIFDELLLSQLALSQRRSRVRACAAHPCPPPEGGPPADLFPFLLTGAQQRVIAEISADLARSEPMQRLVQGDVGAGKTAVAFAAAAQVLAAGGQVAFMAPTGILAAQHQQTLAPWVERLGFRMALLTAATPRGSRESILSLLAAGQIHLLVGTHALLAERVAFARLSLAVVDEQHRFGVAQRARLRDQGEAHSGRSPHLLVMTATPIPRTLALTVYGDLDLSVVDELPPGRVAPRTHVFPVSKRSRLYERVKAHLQAGKRAFVVCPLVAESEALEAADAEQTYEDLRERLAPHPVGLVHGRMANEDKARVLQGFREGHLSVLVATTVVEVGVDVPDAEIMVVESAQRFGLAQLHQLRGRVGRRAGADALCLLMADRDATGEAERRLQVMTETADGFRIAEADLRIRGPGELLGLRQAGGGDLGLAGATAHPELVSRAQQVARELVAQDPELARPEHRALAGLLRQRWAGRVYGEDSG
jgi:ATP-dependent DNA helicase RecG